ncbi:MAG: hypothetical protein WC046_06980 [Candidatus Bathyarchaeia archaeon]
MTLAVAIIPAVSAVSDTKTITGSHYEGVGAGVAGDKIGTYYYSCSWHSGVWLGSGVSFYSLSWTFYGGGSTLETGTTFTDTSHDRTSSGPYHIVVCGHLQLALSDTTAAQSITCQPQKHTFKSKYIRSKALSFTLSIDVMAQS